MKIRNNDAYMTHEYEDMKDFINNLTHENIK